MWCNNSRKTVIAELNEILIIQKYLNLSLVHIYTYQLSHLRLCDIILLHRSIGGSSSSLLGIVGNASIICNILPKDSVVAGVLSVM